MEKNKDRILNEDFVRNRVIEWLSSKGYNKCLKVKGMGEHGIDIMVRHSKYARYFIVEAKGDASKDVKHPPSRREVSFLIVLGQILTRMKTKAKYWYAIALPESYKSKIITRLPWGVCNKLRLKVLFVNHKGKVEVVSWKDLKRFQSKI